MDGIMGFAYQKRRRAAFDVSGFTKIVRSGGELYMETRADGRWDELREMNPSHRDIFGVASFDRECAEGRYWYTIGVVRDGDFRENPRYGGEMFTIHVRESDWVVFAVDFEADYGAFWQKDPYAMIRRLGCEFNNAVGLHMDVYGADYDGRGMEFWMPVKSIGLTV